LPARTLPTFTAAPRDFARGSEGEKMSFPSHPQLEKTHRIRGDDTARSVLTGAVLDLLAREPEWALEGKDNKLVIYRAAAPGDPGGFLRAEQISAFVDGAVRIGGLFGIRWSPRQA